MAGGAVTNTFSGGMNKDLDYSLLKSNQYIDAQNYKLIADENANGFVFENAEGNSQFIDISVISGLDDTYFLVGHCYVYSYLVMFFTTNEADYSPTAGINKILRVKLDKDKVHTKDIIFSDELLTDKLEFSGTFPIKAIGHFEAEDNIKVYWTDNYNDIKWMNIMDENLSTYNVDMFDLVPNFPYDDNSKDAIRIKFNSYTQGNIDCSAVQYSYQYFIPRGPTTVFAPASVVVPIPDTNSIFSDKVAGGETEENSGYGVKLDLAVSNENFTKIRFVAIQYDTYEGVPTIRVFSERDLEASSSLTMSVVDAGQTLTELNYDDYLVQTNISLQAKDLAIKNNYLFAGNVREYVFDITADCRAYRHNSIGTAVVYESNQTDYLQIDDDGGGAFVQYADVPETHDCLNLYNKSNYSSTNDENANQYIFQADGATLGAEGPNVKVSVALNEDDIIDVSPLGDKDKWEAGTFLYDPGVRSWQRNEVYRIGLVFRNEKMQPTPVKWVCDFKMPWMYEDSTDYGFSYYSAPYAYRRRLGITVQYTGVDRSWSSIGATSVEVVAVPRSTSDRSILAQGIVQKTFVDTGTSTYFPVHLMTSEGYTYSSGGVTDSSALFRLISPEISFNKNLQYQDGDFVHYLGYYFHSAGQRDATSSYIHMDKVYNYLGSSSSSLAAADKEELDDAKVIGYVADEDYTMSVGGREYVPYVKPQISADEGGPCTTHGCLSTVTGNLASWWTGSPGRIAMANYKRDIFTAQYGGVDYHSRQNNTYISVSDPVIRYSGVQTVTTYEGDTFVDWFFYNNACIDIDKANTATTAATFLFPVESSISLSHRLDPGIHRNLGSRSALLTQEISGTWESDAVDGTTRTWEQDTALYQYNPVYSQQSNAAFFLADNDNVDNTSSFQTRIRRSELKINGETIDSFTIFKPNNFTDLDGQYGPLNNLEIFKNNLYFWQDTAFGIASVNVRSLIQDNQVGALALGTGGVLDRIDYISDTIGNQNQFGIAKSKNALYWIDNNKNEFVKFDKGLNSISKVGGIQTWFNNIGQVGDAKLVFDHKYNDIIATITFAREATCTYVAAGLATHWAFTDSVGLDTGENYNVIIKGEQSAIARAKYRNMISYDNVGGETGWIPVLYSSGEVGSVYYITIDNDPNYRYTLTFSEMADAFTSFNSFTPARYIQLDKSYLTTADYHDLYLHNSNTANRSEYYGVEYDSEFTTVFNKDYPYTKTWDTLQWFTESEDGSGINQFKDTFDTLTIYNDYQHTGDRDLYYRGDSAPVTRPTEIVRRDRTFSMQIPRNIVDISVTSNPDITSSGSWDETQTFKERIRDKYIVVNTTYDNTNNYIFSIPYIIAGYRKSAR